MTSVEKMKMLIDIQRRGNLAKIRTLDGDTVLYKLCSPAEDEDDWAYDVITVGNKSEHYTIECDFISSIEELSVEDNNTIKQDAA